MPRWVGERAAGAGRATCRGVAPAAIRPRVAPGGGAAARPGEPPAAASGRTARAPLLDGGVASPGERPELERRGPGCRRYGAPGAERVLPELGESCAGRGFAPVLRGVPRTGWRWAVGGFRVPARLCAPACRRMAAAAERAPPGASGARKNPPGFRVTGSGVGHLVSGKDATIYEVSPRGGCRKSRSNAQTCGSGGRGRAGFGRVRCRDASSPP